VKKLAEEPEAITPALEKHHASVIQATERVAEVKAGAHIDGRHGAAPGKADTSIHSRRPDVRRNSILPAIRSG